MAIHNESEKPDEIVCGLHRFTLHAGMYAALNKIYPIYEDRAKQLEAKTLEALQKEVNRLMKKDEKTKAKQDKVKK